LQSLGLGFKQLFRVERVAASAWGERMLRDVLRDVLRVKKAARL